MVQEISTKSLSRTEKVNTLLRIYQETVKGEKPSPGSKDKSINIETQPISYIKPEQSKICATKVRERYNNCRKTEKTNTDVLVKSQCTDTFNIAYSICFFGNTLNVGHSEPSICLRFCMLYMDECLMESDKLEIFTCMKARDQCLHHCDVSGCGASPKWRRSVTGKKLTTENESRCQKNCGKQKETCLKVFKNNIVCNYAYQECSSTCRVRSRISPPSLKTSVMVEE